MGLEAAATEPAHVLTRVEDGFPELTESLAGQQAAQYAHTSPPPLP